MSKTIEPQFSLMIYAEQNSAAKKVHVFVTMFKWQGKQCDQQEQTQFSIMEHKQFCPHFQPWVRLVSWGGLFMLLST